MSLLRYAIAGILGSIAADVGWLIGTGTMDGPWYLGVFGSICVILGVVPRPEPRPQ